MIIINNKFEIGEIVYSIISRQSFVVFGIQVDGIINDNNVKYRCSSAEGNTFLFYQFELTNNCDDCLVS